MLELAPWIKSLAPIVAVDLRRRYAGSVLGASWAIVAPLVEVGIYGAVFGLALGVAQRSHISYVVLICSGLLPWAALRESLETCASLLADNRWVRRSRVPLDLLVARQVISAAPRALVGLIVVLGAALLGGLHAHPLALLLPLVAFALQLLATHGLGLLAAPLAALAPDARPVLTSALTLLTFASPILYPESLVHGGFATALAFNPFTHLLRLYRAPLEPLAGSAVLASLGVVAACALVALLAGVAARSWLGWRARDAL